MDEFAVPDSNPAQRMTLRVLAVLIVGSGVGFDPWGWAAFGPVKWLIVTTLLSLAVTGLTTQSSIAVNRRSALVWAGFLGWGVMAGLFALDPVYAWIGTPDRHLGLLAWCLFAVAFLAGQTVASTLRPLLRAVVVATLGIGVYSMLELVGVAPIELVADSSRLGGPFGSPAYLGAALALLIPVAIGAALDGLGSLGWRIVSGLAAVLGIVAILGSQTRAAWVGLMVAVLFSFPLWKRWLRRNWWVGAGLVVVAAALILATPLGERAVSVFDLNEGTTRGRIDEWQVGGSVLVDHPVVGTGFEGYRIAFPGNVDADYERRYTRRVTPDRAHNGALDVGVTTGLPGLVFYVVGAIWLVGRARRGLRSGDVGLAGIAAGVVGYLAQQQFLFPIAEVDPVFWVLAGVLVASAPQGGSVVRLGLPRAIGIGGAALAVAALVVGGLDVAADHQTKEAFEQSAVGDQIEALAAADRAVALRPDSIRYSFVAATIAAQPGTVHALDEAMARFDKALDVSPRDPILRAEHAGLLLGRARLTTSPDDIQRAVDAFQELIAADPNNAQNHLQVGVALALAGDTEGAESAWLTAEGLAPTSAAPSANLVLLYLNTGRIEEASEAFDRARAIDPDNPSLPDLEARLRALTEGAGS